jgi:myo-inositol 2-dehydrogenase/D-chiro-inositol 1-dehydrogenase
MGAFHAANLAGRVPSVELVRLVDKDERVARRVSDQVEGVGWSTDYSDVLNDPAIEAVIISTNVSTHVALVEEAAAAGKHIFCEKPLSQDLKSTRWAIEAVEAAGVGMQVGFHRRYDSAHRAAHEKIAAGEIGDVYLLRLSTRDMEPPGFEFLATSGGMFIDVGLHDFDEARWLAGEVEEVSALGTAVSDPRFAEIGDVDVSLITLRFANGALGVIDNSRVSGYGFECSAEVMGSEGTVRVGRYGPLTLETLRPGAASRPYALDFMEHFSLAYVEEMDAFARAILEDRAPAPTGADAEAAFVIAQAATRSYREGRPIRLKHEARDGVVVYEEA